jgi:hypothetical protein
MKNSALIFILFLTAEIFSYPFTLPFYDEEFFLYPLLNYDQSLDWKKTREGHLYEGGLVQTSHGSLTTWLLMSSEEAVINRDIGSDFTFRFRYRKYVNRHLSYEEHSASAGLGYDLNGNFTLMAETDLSSEKAEIDIKPGILFKFQTVYAYAGVNFNDFLFDIKNTGDGVSNSTPLTLSTDIRFSFSRLYFFISGNYGTGIDRTWTENPLLDPDIVEHKNHVRNLYARIEYDVTDYFKIYSESYWDDFYDEKKYDDIVVWDSSYANPTDPNDHWHPFEPEISEYKFSASLSSNRLGTVFSLNERHIFDAGLSYAVIEHEFDLIDGQALENGHADSYTVKYPALLPYIIYKYRVHSKFTAEASYMGSYTLDGGEDNYFNIRWGEEYWDKELLKLGIEFRFSPNAGLYLSAGQLINTGVFGGGNARFNFFF